jgi:hypothetical protein
MLEGRHSAETPSLFQLREAMLNMILATRENIWLGGRKYCWGGESGNVR